MHFLAALSSSRSHVVSLLVSLLDICEKVTYLPSYVTVVTVLTVVKEVILLILVTVVVMFFLTNNLRFFCVIKKTIAKLQISNSSLD